MYFGSPVTLQEGMALAIALQFVLLFWLIVRQSRHTALLDESNDKLQLSLTTHLHQLHLDLSQSYQTSQNTINEKVAQGQLKTQQIISETMQKQMTDVREQMNHSFQQHASSLTSHLQLLTEEIRTHLHSLTQQVNHKLTEGFEKTSSTFIDVVKDRKSVV